METIILDKDRGNLYSLGSELGSGSYGRCVSAIDMCTGQKFACKTQKNSQISESEVKIHANLLHVNIVQLVSSFIFCDKRYLIMELCSNGSLTSFMRKIQFLDNPEVRCIAKQIVSGLEYLHGKFIIHRDLTPSNVLLDANLTVKIADFGLAIEVKRSSERPTKFCGTPNYVSPEVVRQEPYGFQVDIWALGCIIYVMLTGTEPFRGRNDLETCKNIASIKYGASSRLHKKASDLIKAIFVNDPDKRLNVCNILKHSYFKTGRTPKDLNLKYGQVENALLEGHGSKAKFINDEAKEENLPTTTLPKMSAKELALYLKTILLAKVKKTGPCITKECEPFICVTRWVHFLDSGFAYHLSDGSLGFHFENASLLCRKQGAEMYYQPAIGDVVTFTKDAVPAHLTELMSLMSKVNLKLLDLPRSGPIACSTDLIYVKRAGHSYIGEDKAYHSTTMFFSNGTCQINFADREKMIINRKDDALIFLRPDDTTKKYNLTGLKLQGVPSDIRTRLEHAFTILLNID